MPATFAHWLPDGHRVGLRILFPLRDVQTGSVLSWDRLACLAGAGRVVTGTTDWRLLVESAGDDHREVDPALGRVPEPIHRRLSAVVGDTGWFDLTGVRAGQVRLSDVVRSLKEEPVDIRLHRSDPVDVWISAPAYADSWILTGDPPVLRVLAQDPALESRWVHAQETVPWMGD